MFDWSGKFGALDVPFSSSIIFKSEADDNVWVNQTRHMTGDDATRHDTTQNITYITQRNATQLNILKFVWNGI